MEQSINDELLTRYLANEVTASEQELVDKWLADSEANRQYLDSLRQVWQLAAARPLLEMDMEEKWTQFRQAQEGIHSGERKNSLAEEHSGKENEFSEREHPEKEPVKEKVFTTKHISMLATAAAIALLIIASWPWLNKHPAQQIAQTNTSGTAAMQDSLHHKVNNTGKEIRLTMADGTNILLADKSALTWREPFLHSRAISMTGKALFHVSKNGQHPFTVISGDISTTVLGTSFEVNTFHDITVRLYSGKVMITSSNTRRMKNKVYLSPGQEFIYGPQIIVRAFLLQLPAVTKDNHPAEDPYIANGEESNWYMFNNQSLEEVLNQLEAIYKVKIIYHKADVKDIYFTARYERTESLVAILQRIAKLNNLKITDNDSVMIIKK